MTKHVAVETTWGVYQAMIAAYRERDQARAREQMHEVIQALADAVPAGLTELRKLGATLNRRDRARPRRLILVVSYPCLIPPRVMSVAASPERAEGSRPA